MTKSQHAGVLAMQKALYSPEAMTPDEIREFEQSLAERRAKDEAERAGEPELALGEGE